MTYPFSLLRNQLYTEEFPPLNVKVKGTSNVVFSGQSLDFKPPSLLLRIK